MDILLAQATDPLSGGAGWMGAGLLGLVLAWLLLKHLPTLMTSHEAHVSGLVLAFTKEQQLEREHCARLHTEQMAEHRVTQAAQTQTRHEMRNMLNQLLLKQAVEQAVKKKDIEEV